MWSGPSPLGPLGTGWRVLAALEVGPPGETTGPVILVAGGLAALVIFLLTSVIGSGQNTPQPDEAPPSVRFPDPSIQASTPPAAGTEDASRAGSPEDPVAPSPENAWTPTSQTEAPQRDRAAEGSPRQERTAGWVQVMEMGRIAGGDLDVETLEEALDAAEDAGLGDPEIVDREAGTTTVRLADCRTCARGGPPGVEGCPFEAGFLEAAVAQFEDDEVTVLESACRSSGGDACEFEIWH